MVMQQLSATRTQRRTLTTRAREGEIVIRSAYKVLAYLVAAGVAVHALPEPYVPGSGDRVRVPAEFRLVLAGYVGIAGGVFATTLAFSAALIFSATTSTSCSPWPSWRVFARVFGGSGWRSRRSTRVSGFEAASAAQRAVAICEGGSVRLRMMLRRTLRRLRTLRRRTWA